MQIFTERMNKRSLAVQQDLSSICCIYHVSVRAYSVMLCYVKQAIDDQN